MSATADHLAKDIADRAAKAVACLEQLDKPQWKRTTEAMLCFKGLPLDRLSSKLERRLDRSLGRINDTLEKYPLQTWDDYQKVSAADLTRIGDLLKTLAD
jgi:hypothetical protein